MAPSEMKEETAHRVRAGDVGASATLRSFACTEWKRRMMVIHLDQLSPYEGAAQDEWPIRTEQQEWMESSQHENLASGKEGETDYKCHKYGPWKRINGSVPYH
jgi:hypothetical protein